MKKIGFVWGASVALAAMASSASANTLILPSPYNATLTWNNDGTVEYNGVAYTAVQQQDKIFSGFSSGSDLPAGSTVLLSHSVVGGDDQHTITFTDPFGSSGPGATFSWGYDITITDPTLFAFQTFRGDILQTVGSSTLVKNITAEDGDAYLIDFTKTGSSGYSGIVSATLNSNDVVLAILDKLTIGANGSDASGVSNSVVEAPIPEPSTWALFGVGFSLLGGLGWKSRKGLAAFD
jgi:hypothetical protein